ncbi:MAG: prohibitin family protein [Leptolyngbya sp.]|nr:prohibitin family protein [Candidatus Melainabacteria bacterium]
MLNQQQQPTLNSVYKEDNNNKVAGILIAVVGLFCVMFALPLLAGFWVSVDSGHVGVLKTMGAVSNDVLYPGFHYKRPLMDDVIQLDTRLKSFEVRATAASKDLQTVETTISVQHSLAPALAPECYQTIGDVDRVDVTVVAPAVQESLKAITAKYTAEELVTKREVVKQMTTDAIRGYIGHTLNEKKLNGAVLIANVAITDFDFSKEFNLSIEAKVKAEQQALQAKNEKERRITEAEAAAREKELSADAAAYQIQKESIARANAIQREANALSQNPSLVQLRAVEKWDGQLPTFSGGGAVPFINLPDLSRKQVATKTK